jgi:hypothetical protein
MTNEVKKYLPGKATITQHPASFSIDLHPKKSVAAPLCNPNVIISKNIIFILE